MGTGMGSSRCDFFSMQYFTLLLLMNAACCYVQTQSTLCHDDERSALLQFKASFTIDNCKSASGEPFAYPKVASWGRPEGDPHKNDCCSWDGVECNEDSGHVIGLDLASSCLHGSINSNSSLFTLVHLQRLDLSHNDFNRSHIPSRLGYDLTSLTYLNLSWSAFTGDIPSEISYLSKLSALDLSSYWPALKLPNFKILVQNLTNIKQLELSMVDIGSTMPNTLVNLSSLTSLRLRQCKLEGKFPAGIFHLPNLQVLDLALNYHLTGSFPHDLNRSSPLNILDLQATNVSGHLPASIGNLRALNQLTIESNSFISHFPSSLSNLTQLKSLYLSFIYQPDLPIIHNSSDQVTDSWSWLGKLTKLTHLTLVNSNLRADIPSSLANLTQLLELHLSQNHITGEIPSFLMQLTQLRSLRLRINNLHGAIPRSLFELRNLEYIYLDSNNLSGSVELDEFSKLEKLRVLTLSLNKLSVQIKTGLNAIAPQLKAIGLGSCNITEFPEFLKYTSELKDLDLSDNNLHGQIPKWMWNSTRTLWFLNLSHNHLTGFEENLVTIPWHELHSLELDSNMLRGSLPIPSRFISYYSVSNNEYEGEVPEAFCKTKTLYILDLSNNNLNGMIPPCFKSLRYLEILKLQNNSFHGDIPRLCSDRSTKLAAIDLSYNQLQGKLPRSIANCPQLMFLTLGNNQISDTFPSWLGKLRHLKVLSLRSNAFHGIIGKPASSYEFPELSIVDLSSNDFSGMFPSDYLENWNAMKSVDETEQMYIHYATFFGWGIRALANYDYPITVFSKGMDLKYSKTPYLLRLIDLSSNRFEGQIPAIIGNLRAINLLNLSNNTLTGLIPSSFGNLTALESLDLSQNQLSGKIPSDLAQLTFLAYFNVSHNRLYGPIPQGRQFDTFLEDAYQGNSGLCGKPLSNKCGDSESKTPQTILDQDEGSGFQIELDWFVVLPGVVAGLIAGMVGGNFWTAKKHDWFEETFSRRRQTRSTTPRRGFRT